MKTISVTGPPTLISRQGSRIRRRAVRGAHGCDILSLASASFSHKGALPYLHKSLLAPGGGDVSGDLRRFSFKKAWENAKFYAQPVKITRIRRTGISAIGFRETAEKGKVSDYFVAKKEGVSGMPAPVKIFFPEGGGEPKISYVGSL